MILNKIRELAAQAIEYKDPLKGLDIPFEGRLLFNENLFLPDYYYRRLIARVLERLDEAVRFYPSTSYKEEVLAKLCRVYNLKQDYVMFIAGADEGIKLALELSLLSNRRVLVIRPCYSMPMVYSVNMGITCDHVLLRPSLELPVDEIVQLVRDKKYDIVYICNPNNPLGVEHSLSEVREIAEKVDALVVVDETYYDYASQDHSKLAYELSNVVVIRSLSKSWGLAGLRVGYMIASPELVKLCRGLAQPFNISSIALVMIEAALEMHDIVKKCVEEAKIVREYLQRRLAETPGVKKVYPSATNFVTFRLDERLDPDLVLSRLREHRIFVRKLEEPLCENCLRVTVAPRHIIDKFLEVLENVLSSLQER